MKESLLILADHGVTELLKVTEEILPKVSKIIKKCLYIEEVSKYSMSEDQAILGLFEKYLTLWVIFSMIVGFLLGNFFPELGSWIESLQVGDVSIPMGICLFLIMYPTMVNIEFEET